jgi:hypothetical protein
MWLLAQLFFSAKVWQHTVVKKGASDGDFFLQLGALVAMCWGNVLLFKDTFFDGLKFFFYVH